MKYRKRQGLLFRNTNLWSCRIHPYFCFLTACPPFCCSKYQFELWGARDTEVMVMGPWSLPACAVWTHPTDTAGIKAAVLWRAVGSELYLYRKIHCISQRMQAPSQVTSLFPFAFSRSPTIVPGNQFHGFSADWEVDSSVTVKSSDIKLGILWFLLLLESETRSISVIPDLFFPVHDFWWQV